MVRNSFSAALLLHGVIQFLGPAKAFHGVRIPARSSVTWKPDTGDFTWLHLEITDIQYD